MSLVKLPNGSILVEENNVIVLNMRTEEATSHRLAICTDPVKNLVLQIDWHGRWCFVDKATAEYLVSKNYAVYAHENDISAIEQYLESVT